MRDDMEPKDRDPLVTTVNMIGDSYTFLIIREAFFGAARFEAFAAGLHISRARLSERLKHLVRLGIFEKRACAQASGRYLYGLTIKGLSLFQIALALHEWGEKWRPQHTHNTLCHQMCGTPIAQKTICLSCHEEVRYEDIIWPSSPILMPCARDTNTVRGWRQTGPLSHVYKRDGATAKTLEAIGDRWSMLIMYLSLHGPFRFKEARHSLGVSDNILSKRLKHLIHQNLLIQETALGIQTYAPTHAGMALLPAVLAQRMWARQWERWPDTPDTKHQWTELHHTSCGEALETKCVCTACEHVIFPGDVTLREARERPDAKP